MNFNGLKSSEVEVSRTTYGSNKLPEPELKKWYHFAKEALTEPITMILIIIALFQLVLGAMGVMSLSEPVMIIVVLAIVTGIAIKTGLGVQKSAAELRAKTAVRYCDVVRDGSVQTINKDDLVVGDLVLLRTGQEILQMDLLLMEKFLLITPLSMERQKNVEKFLVLIISMLKQHQLLHIRISVLSLQEQLSCLVKENDCYRCWC